MTQPVLPLLPAEARSIGPSAGYLEGPDGGMVLVFGLVTFNYAAGDDAGRRLAAVQLVTTKIASATDVAAAFGVSPATLWRWAGAFTEGGVVALVRQRPGPRRVSKLTEATLEDIVDVHRMPHPTCLHARGRAPPARQPSPTKSRVAGAGGRACPPPADGWSQRACS